MPAPDVTGAQLFEDWTSGKWQRILLTNLVGDAFETLGFSALGT